MCFLYYCSSFANVTDNVVINLIRFQGFIRLPRLFYATHKDSVPQYVTIEDKFGNKFNGEIWDLGPDDMVIMTNVRKIFNIYTYRFFAIVRLTYISKGRFKLFVPDNTNYFRTHRTIPGLLPYNYKGPDMSGKFDSVGMYEYEGCIRRRRWEEIRAREEGPTSDESFDSDDYDSDNGSSTGIHYIYSSSSTEGEFSIYWNIIICQPFNVVYLYFISVEEFNWMHLFLNFPQIGGSCLVMILHFYGG